MEIPRRKIKLGRHPNRKFFTKLLANRDESLSIDGQVEIVSLVAKNAKSISDKKPLELLRLKTAIETANLESFIDNYKSMLNGNFNELHWQRLFEDNPSVLSLTFGQPYIRIGNQSSVGGQKIDGSGTKIADFLMKNPLTNNIALVEIKKPDTALVYERPYRNNVHGPSRELSGSVIQVLSQRYSLARDISGIKDRNKMPDIESYAILCLLIVGTIPKDDGERSSFELYRNNVSGVLIVTF